MRADPNGVYMYVTDPEMIRDWMRDRDLSYADLARAVGVSRQFIHQLATGTKKTCRPQVARQIEKFLLPPKAKRQPGVRPLFVARRSDAIGDVSVPVGGRV